ncbi:hypothetical protein [Streptomyces tanashiensis]
MPSRSWQSGCSLVRTSSKASSTLSYSPETIDETKAEVSGNRPLASQSDNGSSVMSG